MAGKVIRCECGVLFDTDAHAVCPSCGTPPRTEPTPSASGSQAPSGSLKPLPSTAGGPQRPWPLYAGAAAVVLLVAAFGIRLLLDSGEGTDSAKTDNGRQAPPVTTQEDANGNQTETPPVQDGSADKPIQTTVQQGQQQSQQTATVPTPSPQPVPDNALVDSALVGAWSMDYPGAQGLQHWIIEIGADGTYAFTSEGGGPIIKHVGSFKALHGAWSLKSTTINWEDGGTYQLPDPNTFHMLGKLGLGVWSRVKG